MEAVLEQVNTTFELITPEKAQEYFNSSVNNRPISTQTVLYYAEQMEKGQWKVNTGETIKFDINDHLIDGQHRMLAVIKYGKPVEFEIRKNLPPQAIHYIDQNKKRSPSDVLAMHGVPYYTVVASIVRNYLSYKQGFAKNRISNIEIWDYYQTDSEELIECAKKSEKYYKEGGGKLYQSDIAFILYVTRKINEFIAEEFMNKVALQLNIQSIKDPASQLRNFLIDDKKSDKSLSSNKRIMTWIKFWNKYRKGEELSKVHIPTKFEKAI